jgi:hypothetical protein
MAPPRLGRDPPGASCLAKVPDRSTACPQVLAAGRCDAVRAVPPGATRWSRPQRCVPPRRALSETSPGIAERRAAWPRPGWPRRPAGARRAAVLVTWWWARGCCTAADAQHPGLRPANRTWRPAASRRRSTSSLVRVRLLDNARTCTPRSPRKPLGRHVERRGHRQCRAAAAWSALSRPETRRRLPARDGGRGGRALPPAWRRTKQFDIWVDARPRRSADEQAELGEQGEAARGQAPAAAPRPARAPRCGARSSSCRGHRLPGGSGRRRLGGRSSTRWSSRVRAHGGLCPGVTASSLGTIDLVRVRARGESSGRLCPLRAG